MTSKMQHQQVPIPMQKMPVHQQQRANSLYNNNHEKYTFYGQYVSMPAANDLQHLTINNNIANRNGEQYESAKNSMGFHADNEQRSYIELKNVETCEREAPPPKLGHDMLILNAANGQLIDNGHHDVFVDSPENVKTPDESCTGSDVAASDLSIGLEEKSPPDHHARRPMNAFLIFCKRHRGIVREKYPNLENRYVLLSLSVSMSRELLIHDVF